VDFAQSAAHRQIRLTYKIDRAVNYSVVYYL
jgi:hypothetical protein